MMSIGKRIPLVASIAFHTRRKKTQHKRAGGTTANATEPKHLIPGKDIWLYPLRKNLATVLCQ